MEQREGVVGGPSAEVDRASLLTMLTTEHFTLQGARASTISESAARAALCVGMVSSALIALGFLGHASEFGAVFDAFALEHDRGPVVGGTTLALSARLLGASIKTSVLVGEAALVPSLAAHRAAQRRTHASARESTSLLFPTTSNEPTVHDARVS